VAVIQYLDIILGARTSKLDNGLDRSKKGVKDLRSDLAKRLPGGGFISNAVSSFRSMHPAALLAAVGVAGITAAVTGATIALSKIHDEMGTIDEIAKSAAQANVTFRELAGFRLAVGESSGLDESAADKALVKLQLRLREAERTGNELDQMLADIGLNSGELLRRGPLDAMRQLAVATQDMQDPAAQLELAFRLFEEEGSKLVNTLRGGPEALAESIGFADQWLSLTQAQAKQVENSNDAWGRVNALATGMWRQIAAEAAPVLEVIADEILAFADGFGGTQEIIPTIVDGMLIVAGVLFDLVEASMTFQRVWHSIAMLDFEGAGKAIQDGADFSTAQTLLEKVNRARQDALEASQQIATGLEDPAAIEARMEAEKLAAQQTAVRMTQLQQREKELAATIDRAADSAIASTASGPTAGALQRGSVAAFSAGNANERNAQDAAKQRAEQLRIAEDSREELANIRREIANIQTIGNAG
jgi:hypothetical protein